MNKKSLFLILTIVFFVFDVVLGLIVFKPEIFKSSKFRERPITKEEGQIIITDDQSGTTLAVNSQTVGQYEKFEISYQSPKQYANPFDPSIVDIQAHFISPTGKEESWPAFWYQDYEKSNQTVTNRRGEQVNQEVYTSQGEPLWKVRYSPTEIGEYQYYLTVKDQSGETRYPANGSKLSFKSEGSDVQGFIGVSQKDLDYFVYENGQTFFPIGHGPEVSLEKLDGYAKNKMNIVQTEFVGGFKAGLDKLDKYDLERLYQFDELLNRAEELGIYLEMGALVGWPEFAEDPSKMEGNAHWDENTYNSKNGGPIDYPFQFDSNQQAKNYFKQLLRYYIARWGYSSNVFCWQLWGEFDMRNYTAYAAGLNYYSEEALISWHREMSEYVKSIDSRHLITTAEAGDTIGAIWQLPDIDFVSIHNYGEGIETTLPEKIVKYQIYHKPILVQEYGPMALSNTGISEEEYRAAYHNPLWRTVMQKLSGSAMKWTWYGDPIEETMNLDNDYKIMAEFFLEADFTNQSVEELLISDLSPKQNYEPIIRQKRTGESVVVRPGGLRSPVEIFGLGNSQTAYLWLHDFRYSLTDLQQTGYQAQNLANIKFQLNNMANGSYQVEFWNTLTGQVEKRQFVADNNTLIIEAPDFQKDIAVKIVKQ